MQGTRLRLVSLEVTVQGQIGGDDRVRRTTSVSSPWKSILNWPGPKPPRLALDRAQHVTTGTTTRKQRLVPRRSGTDAATVDASAHQLRELKISPAQIACVDEAPDARLVHASVGHLVCGGEMPSSLSWPASRRVGEGPGSLGPVLRTRPCVSGTTHNLSCALPRLLSLLSQLCLCQRRELGGCTQQERGARRTRTKVQSET